MDLTLHPCRRGHPRTVSTVYIFQRPNGTFGFRCRQCHTLTSTAWALAEYRANPTFRRARAARSLAYYHAHKVLKRTPRNACL